MAKGADMNKLFKIPVREKLGYAKLADPATFEAEYDKINEDMKAQIAAVLEGGREDD